MQLRLAFILSLIVVLVACGGGQEAEVSSANITASRSTPTTVMSSDTQPSPADSVLAAFGAPTADDFTLPLVPELAGTLYFTSGTTLYKAAFDGNTATPIITDISAATVETNERYLAYTSPGERRLRMVQTDLETQTSVELTTISGKLRQVRGHILGWSPNGEWALVVDVIGLRWVLVNRDASTSYELGDGASPFWLADNTLLVVKLDPPLGTVLLGLQIAEAQHVIGFDQLDPVTGERTELNLSPSIMAHQGDYIGLLKGLSAAGLALAYPAELSGYLAQGAEGWWAVRLPEDVLRFQPRPCDTWVIDHLGAGSDPEIVYEATDVVWLSDLTPLDDGTLLFLEWAFVECDIQGTMTVRLLRLMPSGEVSEVVPSVSPIEDGRNNLNLMVYNQSRRFAVSPDQQYVVWSAGDLESGVAELHLTALNGGGSVTLLAAGPRRNANDYLDTAMFNTVFWNP